MYLLSCCWKHELLSTSFFFGPKQYFMQTEKLNDKKKKKSLQKLFHAFIYK